MVEFGVLAAIRSCFSEEGIGADFGLVADHIFVMQPQGTVPPGPVVIIDLEEAWTPSASLHPDFGKVTLKISILGDSSDGAESLSIGQQIQQRLDGSTLSVDGSCEATFRKGSSVLDMKKSTHSPRRVDQYYEALVHRSRFRHSSRPLVRTRPPIVSEVPNEPRKTPDPV